MLHLNEAILADAGRNVAATGNFADGLAGQRGHDGRRAARRRVSETQLPVPAAAAAHEHDEQGKRPHFSNELIVAPAEDVALDTAGNDMVGAQSNGHHLHLKERIKWRGRAAKEGKERRNSAKGDRGRANAGVTSRPKQMFSGDLDVGCQKKTLDCFPFRFAAGAGRACPSSSAPEDDAPG